MSPWALRNPVRHLPPVGGDIQKLLQGSFKPLVFIFSCVHLCVAVEVLPVPNQDWHPEGGEVLRWQPYHPWYLTFRRRCRGFWRPAFQVWFLKLNILYFLVLVQKLGTWYMLGLILKISILIANLTH